METWAESLLPEYVSYVINELLVVVLAVAAAIDWAFTEHLLLSNIISAGLLLGLGDLVVQTLDNALGRYPGWHYDFRRNGRTITVGFCLGVFNHAWYAILDGQLEGNSLTTVLKKIALDQAIAGPFFCTAFFIGMGILEGKDASGIFAELSEKFIDVYKADWMFWPAAQFINFYLVPHRFRVFYVNFATLLWNTFLTYMKHKVQVPSGRRSHAYDFRYRRHGSPASSSSRGRQPGRSGPKAKASQTANSKKKSGQTAKGKKAHSSRSRSMSVAPKWLMRSRSRIRRFPTFGNSQKSSNHKQRPPKQKTSKVGRKLTKGQSDQNHMDLGSRLQDMLQQLEDSGKQEVISVVVISRPLEQPSGRGGKFKRCAHTCLSSVYEGLVSGGSCSMKEELKSLEEAVQAVKIQLCSCLALTEHHTQTLDNARMFEAGLSKSKKGKLRKVRT